MTQRVVTLRPIYIDGHSRGINAELKNWEGNFGASKAKGFWRI
jgi:hypothetical protein